MKKFMILFLMLALSVIYLPAAKAQEGGMEEILFMEVPVVYETTKRKEKTQESALNIRVITREDIENYGLRNFRDLFMFIENGFETFKGRDRVYGVRGIMGYANDKIKFLFDGMELPLELGLGEGEFPFNLDEVKRIEIVKGPNTSLFGGNATQATVNVIRYNGEDFVGVKTGLAIGRWNHKRGFVHYAEKPSDDLNYDVYFSAMQQTGPDVDHREWGADTSYKMFKHDVDIPLPDHELVISVNYKNAKFKYRRFEERRNAYTDVYTHNYSDAVAAEFKKEAFLGNDNLELNFSIEASHFGQEYDLYHNDPSIASPLEHKAEKRLEWDAHIYYNPEDNWDLLAGLSGNYWNAVGTPWGTYTTTTSPSDLPYFYLAPDLTSGVSTPEWFPSFCEVNDLADIEAWADFKYKYNEQTSFVLGGRYVYDFVPNDQLRDDDSIPKFNTDRELLRQFFPKAAVVYSPQENMYIKLIYQEAFNRPNTFEQFSAQNTLPMRGTLKATTAKTYELVFDWVINKNMKTLLSAFYTKMEDFTNFAYTGSSWPVVDASKGEVRGFINVGDRKISGLEGTFELKYENYGGIISVGYMLKNKIEPFSEFDPATVGTGAAGILYPADDDDYNKQSAPKWNASIGAWYKILENVTLSTLYTTHQDVQNNEDWTNHIYERDIDSWDIILNVKNLANVKNLDLQLLCKNVLDEDEYFGSAMDPAHREQQWPRYYEGKITYLW